MGHGSHDHRRKGLCQVDARGQAKADALIKLNPDYQTWIAGVAPADQAAAAFVHAATWADDIKKTGSGYVRDDVTAADAADNLGYTELIQHDYWHYYDTPFSTDGTPTKPAPAVNALTQTTLLTTALASNEADDLKSFDLVWLEHLVGDMHQPLHATSRFSKNEPDGDAGGNAEKVQVGTDPATHLHQVWDGLLGDEGTPTDAIAAAASLPADDPTEAAIADPAVWLSESFAIDKTDVYQEVGDDTHTTYQLDAAYITQAKNIALAQASLAADRLANLINVALK